MRVSCLAQEHNTVPQPGHESRPFDPESSALIIRPPRLPHASHEGLEQTFKPFNKCISYCVFHHALAVVRLHKERNCMSKVSCFDENPTNLVCYLSLIGPCFHWHYILHPVKLQWNDFLGVHCYLHSLHYLVFDLE